MSGHVQKLQQPPAISWRRSAWWLASAAIVAMGVAVRLAAARGDLWLDEIWSIELGRTARSALEVVTRIHHDNNHHLNTAYVRLVADAASPLEYRLLAVLSAAGMLAISTLRPLRGAPIEAFATTTLLAASYLLVHYGSEARGYAPAAFFAVAAFHALDRFLETGRRRWAGFFAVAGVLGILSHLTFAYALAGFAAWGACALVPRHRERRLDPLALASIALPFLAAAALWAVDVRYLAIGGGPEYELVAVLRELLRTTFGLPHGPIELLALVPLGAASYEIVALARARDARWVFFIVAIVVAPALLVALRRPDYLAPRYFLVALPFLFMLIGLSFARLATRGRAGIAVCAAALIAFCAVNLFPIARLLRDGRGHYRDAISFMLDRTPGETVTVTSDHEFRNTAVLAYHVPHVSTKKTLVYVTPGAGVPAPDWFLRHDFSEAPAPAPYVDVMGCRYVLAATFPYAGLSGWSWILYGRAD